MKRFYIHTSVDGAPWRVLLDGQPLKTPAGKALVVPSQDLAQAIAQEWRAQGKTIVSTTMPFTQLACTALDRVPAHKDEILRQLLAYVTTDTVCCWADHPDSLVERQEKLWRPLVDWARARFDVSLPITMGMAAPSPALDTLNRLESHMRTLDDFSLAGLAHATDMAGSLVIALALQEKHINANQAFDAAFLESLYQAERWGEEDSALSRRRELKSEFDTLECYFRMIN